MLFFGHLGIPALIGNRARMNIVYVLLFAMMPDIIDKLAFLLGMNTSTRFVGHTLLLVLVVWLAVFIATRKMNLALSAGFGILSHLLLDLEGFVPWFYPFIPYDFPVSQLALHLTFANVLGESLGIICLIALAFEKSDEIKKLI